LGEQIDPGFSRRWLRRDRGKEKFPIPRLTLVLMLSISKAFFDYALTAYIIGLGVYLGFVWQKNLDVDAGNSDSRNIFVVFSAYTGFCFCVYLLLAYPSPYEFNEWSETLERFKAVEALNGPDCESGPKETEGVGYAYRMGKGRECDVQVISEPPTRQNESKP
jgi:hypothetical protein